jgi:hypothetical protein
MSSSVPVMVLTGLGLIIAVLGLFAGGSVELVVIGLVAVGVAGLLQVLGTRREG